MEKISVIVPAYNSEQFIHRCISSIQAQTYRNLEIIVVDDGSADHTGAIVEKMSKTDNRIRLIKQKNSGAAAARLNGALTASGSWIGFVDSDDMLDNDMYEKLMANARRYNADISHCGYRRIKNDKVKYYYGTGELQTYDKNDGLKSLIKGDTIGPGLWNKLIRKALIDEVIKANCVDTDIKYLEDLLLNFYVFKRANKSVFYDICPYVNVCREGSVSQSKCNKKMIMDPILVYKKILDEVPDSADLKNLVFTIMLERLVNAATLKKRKNQEFSREIDWTRKFLRRHLPAIIRCRTRRKILYIWAALSPECYGTVRQIYRLKYLIFG